MRDRLRPTRPPFNASTIQQTIHDALKAAGLDPRAGPMRDVTDTIRRALAAGQPSAAGDVVDVDATEVHAPQPATDFAPHAPPAHRPPAAPRPHPDADAGRFTAHSFANAAGRRAYKLYVPAPRPGHPEGPRPLLVMLHGCTQSADDFAAGTQMNRLADAHGFLVVYPEQTAQANASRCWNWFQPQNQTREAGEPALLAGLVAHVQREHGVDPRRVFVAGLSAGAAMAVVLGETHPELFAGIGVHSGLPYGSAHDIPSALMAMKGGRGNAARRGLKGSAPARKKATQAVPVIVFHGDRDTTVQPSNGAQVVQQARDAHGTDAPVREEAGVATGGRRYTRRLHTDAQGAVRIEDWTLHGLGHAWSGGNASGSYTDPSGPDASAEMVRFFLALPCAAGDRPAD
jgi:poly(hydroxyalkanoate) depolymerase family esterase